MRRGGARLLSWLFFYAVAMAYVEAAVVVYLRRLYYPDAPMELFPLRVWAPADLFVELGREAATLIMILSVAFLAVRGPRRVLAAFLFIFGLWDLFYYFWLKVILGWPARWLEWDILFLIPWAWLGPWTAPAAVALLFVVWGGRTLAVETAPPFPPLAGALCAAGIVLVLLAFLQPAFPLLSAGAETLSEFRPQAFRWGPYTAGLCLMATGLGMTLKGGSAGAADDGKR